MKQKTHRFKVGILVLFLTVLLFGKTPLLSNAQGIGDVIINEFLADPPPDEAGDANRDGVRDAYDDEFVEIVNISASAVDISGWTFNTASTVQHVFPANTVLPPGCGIVIFGGGNPEGNFGDCIVQVALSGGLGLINSDGTIALKDGDLIIDGYSYHDDANKDQSLTRYPELTSSIFMLHSLVPASGGTLFSPGTRVDGSLFSSGCLGDEYLVYLPVVMK